MQSTSPAVEAAAARLNNAYAERIPCTPVRDLIGPSDIEAAYAVQARGVADRISAGATIVGRKVGLTSRAVQQQIGVDQPDLGYLFDDMVCQQGQVIPMSRLMQPKVEAEVAFILDGDLVDGPLDVAQVRAAIGYITAGIEIVDSRIVDWDISFADTVADNGSSALYVLGESRRTLHDVEPVNVEMTMAVNGTQVSEGNGAACLDDPLNAVVWLARQARRFGDPLRAGHVVLSGALGPMIAIRPGDVVTATLSGLGDVTATFSEE